MLGIKILLFVGLIVFAWYVPLDFLKSKQELPLSPSPSPTVSAEPSKTPTAKPSATKKPSVSIKPRASIVAATPKPKATINGSEVFNLVNAYRMANGVPGLSVSDQLCGFAQIRANFVVANNEQAFKDSSSGNHIGLAEQISFDSYSGNTVGENQQDTSFDYPNYGSANVVQSWKQSPAHNSLLLRTEKNGFAVTKGCVGVASNQQATVTILLVGDQ